MELKEIRTEIVLEPVTENMFFGLGEEQKQEMLSRVDQLVDLLGPDFEVCDELFANLDRMYDILGGGDEPPDAESDHQLFLMESVMIYRERYSRPPSEAELAFARRRR